ncbi:MAG: CpsD/CapB family tyrosine-protein kinase [Candidatus Acidiferrales bacterium]
MSRLYEALRKSELEHRQTGAVATEVVRPAAEFAPAGVGALELEGTQTVPLRVSPGSHLVAVTEPQGLPAEKFRVLVTRLRNLRSQQEVKSLQVTSSIVDEGKTLIAANLAITLARHSQNRVLLIEGDLHNPSLHALLGLSHLKGICHWWKDSTSTLNDFLYHIEDLPLWYLPAGERSDEPGEILQSARLTESLMQLSGLFDWIVVDSTPLTPMADANIWNRLVDGTLLVVREGVTPVKALKKGLASLDSPKLIGVVLNGASEFDRVNYYDKRYGAPPTSKNGGSAEKVAEAEA